MLSQPVALSPSDINRFWSKVDRGPPEHCWNWLAAPRGKGHMLYGAFGIGRGKLFQAHRIAFQIAHGPIPVGLVIRHKCDNGRCVNPRHLEIGSQAENTMDSYIRCRRLQIKLSPDDVRDIRLMSRSGLSQRKIAVSKGVTQKAITNILQGKSWAYVN